MFKKVSLFILATILASCGGVRDEQESTSLNYKSEIVYSLNQKDIDGSLVLIEKAMLDNPNDHELKYYLAQAYSLKGNVDIYSLFPIVKMKLFEVAINEWGTVNAHTDSSRRDIEGTVLGDEGNFSSQAVVELEEQLKEIEEINPEKIELNVERKNQFRHEWTDYAYCSFTIVFSSKDLPIKKNLEREFYSSNTVINETCDEFWNSDVDYDERQIKFELKSFAYQQIRKRIKKIKENKTSQKYIKAAFALFESVPVIKKAPELDLSKISYIDDSIKILNELRLSDNLSHRIKNNSSSQLGLLGGFLILGSLKSSVDFDKVNEPIDIACNASVEKLLFHYPHFLNGMKALSSAAEGTTFSERNKDSFSKFKDYLDVAPDELNEKQKEEIKDEFEDFIEENC